MIKGNIFNIEKVVINEESFINYTKHPKKNSKIFQCKKSELIGMGIYIQWHPNAEDALLNQIKDDDELVNEIINEHHYFPKKETIFEYDTEQKFSIPYFFRKIMLSNINEILLNSYNETKIVLYYYRPTDMNTVVDYDNFDLESYMTAYIYDINDIVNKLLKIASEAEEEYNKTIASNDVHMELLYNKAKEYYGEDNVFIKYNTVGIHYPILKITNSNQLSHIIKDAWVVVDYNFEINYIRSSVTFEEVLSCYSHSHVSNLVPFFSTMCLGHGDFRNLTQILSAAILNDEPISEDDVEGYMYLLDNYLHWESLEGTPYKKMELVHNALQRNCATNQMSLSFDVCMSNITQDMLEKLTLTLNENQDVQLMRDDNIKETLSLMLPKEYGLNNKIDERKLRQLINEKTLIFEESDEFEFSRKYFIKIKKLFNNKFPNRITIDFTNAIQILESLLKKEQITKPEFPEREIEGFINYFNLTFNGTNKKTHFNNICKELTA